MNNPQYYNETYYNYSAFQSFNTYAFNMFKNIESIRL